MAAQNKCCAAHLAAINGLGIMASYAQGDRQKRQVTASVTQAWRE